MAAPRAYPILTPEEIRRFWKKVDRGPADRCWRWKLSTKGRGYGAVRIQGQALSAHRVAWEIIHGPVPPRLVVYQAFCNEPSCCNPGHLAVGSKAEAMRSASRHGTKLGRGVGFEAEPYQPKQVAKPYPKLTEKQERAFWEKVEKGGPDDCWLWTAAPGGSGYGKFRAAGRSLVASRVAYALAHGDAPTDMDVCHSCDSPTCVNPAHLFLGSRRKNMEDMVEKGRCNAARGARSGKAKLLPKQVYKIRERSDAGETRVSLADEFGVSAVSIGEIALRRSWKHLPERRAKG